MTTTTTLAAAVTQRGPVPARDAARIGAAVAAALARAHAAGQAHGAVAPDAVLLDPSGAVRLADARGHAPTQPDPAEDVRALGLVLRDAAGRPSGGPLDAVLARMLDGDPVRRPSAAEARDQLDAVADGRPLPPDGRATPPAAHATGRRRTLLAVGVAVLVLAVLGAVLVAPRLFPPGSRVVGPDPRAVDACSLVDPAPLAVFGDAVLRPDVGFFGSCGIAVTTPEGRVPVSVAFEPPRADGVDAGGTVQERDGLRIGRLTELNGICDREILLPDRATVRISARDSAAPRPDLCGIAEVAASTAVDRITGPGLRTRPVPADGLGARDACEVLDRATLPADPEPGFAGWSCSAYGAEASVVVALTRNEAWTPIDGERTTEGGQEIWSLPGTYLDTTGCLLQAPVRPVPGADGTPRWEAVRLLYVTSAGPPEADCAPGRDLLLGVLDRVR